MRNSLINAVVEMDTGVPIANMNLMPVPQILVIMEPLVTTYYLNIVVLVLLDSWELNVNTTSMIVLPTHVGMEELVMTLSETTPVPVHLELKANCARSTLMSVMMELVSMEDNVWTR